MSPSPAQKQDPKQPLSQCSTGTSAATGCPGAVGWTGQNCPLSYRRRATGGDWNQVTPKERPPREALPRCPGGQPGETSAWKTRAPLLGRREQAGSKREETRLPAFQASRDGTGWLQSP